MEYSIIKDKIEELRFTFKHMAEVAGLTTAGLKKALDNGTLRIDHLERISNEIGIPMVYWFKEEANSLEKNNKSDRSENKQTIQDLRETIKELRADKHRLLIQNDELRGKAGLSKASGYE